MFRNSLILISFLCVQSSFSQKLIGEFYVDKIDTALFGTYYTIDFFDSNQFKLLSYECKSVDQGSGTYRTENDSILFDFNSIDTKRTEVIEETIKFDSLDFVRLGFSLETKIRFSARDWYDVSIKGKNIDTVFTSLEYLSFIDLPKSNDTLQVVVSIPAFYDEVIFKVIPSESRKYSLWTTYGFDQFIYGETWRYKIEKMNRRKIILSQEGAKMTFKKKKNNPIK